MNDSVSGYCGSVIGTKFFTKQVEGQKKMLEQSKCHTLDRTNLHAQKDSCGIGATDDWRFAVEMKFNITYWPYIHSAKNNKCVKDFFGDSYENLSLSMAKGSYVIAFSSIALGLLTTVF